MRIHIGRLLEGDYWLKGTPTGKHVFYQYN